MLMHVCLYVQVFRGQFLKDMMMSAAMAYSIPKYESEMNIIKTEMPEAYEWLIEKHPQHWARSHFRTTPTCDILLNNLCESFNGTRAILMARYVMSVYVQLNLMFKLASTELKLIF